MYREGDISPFLNPLSKQLFKALDEPSEFEALLQVVVADHPDKALPIVERALTMAMVGYPTQCMAILDAISGLNIPYQAEIVWHVGHMALVRYEALEHLPSVFERLLQGRGGDVSMYSVESTLSVAEALGANDVAQVLRLRIWEEQERLKANLMQAIGLPLCSKAKRKI
ncbi:hypothetical protein [Stenotrophomonas acidaminiphila]